MTEFNLNIDPDQDLIDENVLYALADAIGVPAINDFIDRFFEDCKTRTSRIIEAYEKNCFSEVELEAHTLGTSAATYGALKLETLCRAIEYSKPSKNQSFDEKIKQLHVLSVQSLEILREGMKEDNL